MIFTNKTLELIASVAMLTGRPAIFSLAQDAGLIENPMDALIRDFRLEKKKRARK